MNRLLPFVLLLCASPAFAQTVVRTTVEVNPASGRATVTHRFDAAAVGPLLPKVAKGAPADLADPAAAEALGRYAGRAFRIGRPLKLESYAAQDGQVLITYSAQFTPGAAVTLDSDLFEDADPAAETLVELRAGGPSQTLRFDRQTPPQTVRPPAP